MSPEPVHKLREQRDPGEAPALVTASGLALSCHSRASSEPRLTLVGPQPKTQCPAAHQAQLTPEQLA